MSDQQQILNYGKRAADNMVDLLALIAEEDALARWIAVGEDDSYMDYFDEVADGNF